MKCHHPWCFTLFLILFSSIQSQNITENEVNATTVQYISSTVEHAYTAVEHPSIIVQDASTIVQDASTIVQDASTKVHDTSPTVQDVSSIVQGTSTKVEDVATKVQVSTTVKDASTKVQYTSEQIDYDNQRYFCRLLRCGCNEDEVMESFVDCERRAISEVPINTQFHSKVKEVTFHGNRLKSITTDTFNNGTSVEQLDLSRNELCSIDGASFVTFSSMVTLHLSNNKLSEVSSDLFLGLKSLQILELGHNEISKLPERLFEPTPDLRELKLHHNRLENLQGNSFAYLSKLEKLDLQGNLLQSLPNDIFSHTPHLQWITLEDNRFDYVPQEALQKASMLTSLDMSGNFLDMIEANSLHMLVNVSILHLNRMQYLMSIEKHAFVKLTKLRTLSCCFNAKLTYIHPEAFKAQKHSNRIHLMLRHNALESLPEPTEIEHWASIADFDFSENPWKCDCNLRWMAKLRKNVSVTLRCQNPWKLHGLTMDTLSEDDLVCHDHVLFSTVVLVLASMVALLMFGSFIIIIACSKTPLGLYRRAKKQFTYLKVDPNKDCIDLEWDPSGEM